MSGRCRRCSGASPSPSADTVPSTGYDLPTMRTAARPFLFVGCVELRQTLDSHARDARELMHRLAEVPADSVFFHTFGYFLRHRPFTTAYGNDFARWAAVEIGDRTLAEFRAGLAAADASAIYLHTVEARARGGRRAGDFAEWLRAALELPTLAERFQRVDPYLTTLERVRGRLLSLVDRALEEEPA